MNVLMWGISIKRPNVNAACIRLINVNLMALISDMSNTIEGDIDIDFLGVLTLNW